MTPEELNGLALAAIEQGTNLTLLIPKGHTLSKKFPKGELLNVTDRGKAISYDPKKISAILELAKLI